MMKYWGIPAIPAILLVAAVAWAWRKVLELDRIVIGAEEEKQ